MGRPLFSQSYYSAAPAIYVEPDVLPAAEDPVCERWSYWKPFDPDSEEFFTNEVYEAFIDPVIDVRGDREPSPIIEDSSSPSSSEDDSMSGRVTPIVDSRAGHGVRLSQGQFDAAVIRRVNEESHERLRRDLNHDGTRTIVPFSTTPSPPSTPLSFPTPFSPSLNVDATPRLYSWRDLASPTRGPLVNPTARRSFSRVPTLARRHDVSV